MPEEAAPKRDGEPGVAEPSEPGAAAAQRPAPEPAGPEPAEQTQVIVPPADDTPTEPVSTAKPVPTTEPVSLGKPVQPAAAGADADEPTVVVPAAGVATPGADDPTERVPTGTPAPIWPTQPGATADADSGVAALAGGDADTAPTGRKRITRTMAIVAGVVVLLLLGCGIGAVVLLAGEEEPTTAVAGDCLKGNGIDPGARKTSDVSLSTVTCEDKAAKYKVVGRVEDQPESAANADSKLCDPFPGTEFIYWQGVDGKRGTVLCLTSNQPK